MLTLTSLILLSAFVAPPGDGDPICSVTAVLALQASRGELYEDRVIAWANCANLLDEKEQEECLEDAQADYMEGVAEANAVFEARLALCLQLGEGAYDPDIDPKDYTCDLDNPYWPMPIGATWVYHKETEDGLEEIVVTVLDETREIEGVECRIVNDVVTLFGRDEDGRLEEEGELIEDTDDYYAQDGDGNIWYFGEVAEEYEDGYLATLDGSWLHGQDHAKAGILVWADPVENTTWRQEWFLDEAEDVGTVLFVGIDVEVPGCGEFENCVQTLDFTPLEPGSTEIKTYAFGIGPVMEVDPEDPDNPLTLVCKR